MADINHIKIKVVFVEKRRLYKRLIVQINGIKVLFKDDLLTLLSESANVFVVENKRMIDLYRKVNVIEIII